MKKYEYKEEDISTKRTCHGDNLLGELNKYGDDGWQVISLKEINHKAGDIYTECNKYEVVFMREKKEYCEEGETKIIFETCDNLKAEIMLKSFDMCSAIDEYYQVCFKPYLKYGKLFAGKELTDNEENLLREIADNLHEHFEHVKIE